MKTLKVRRHSVRKCTGGSQLSQSGVALARRLGSTMGPFEKVVTSVSPRARETAIAMGFAVDYEIVTLVSEDEVFQEIEASDWFDSPSPFTSLGKLIAQKGAVWRLGISMVSLWRDLMTSIPDGTSALVISHSGNIEIALACCFPSANHQEWGGGFEICEGALLIFDGNPARFVAVEILRL